MLVQSGSGNVYAVLADTPEFELSVMPQMQFISTSIFLALRCRYKVKSATGEPVQFDPMLVPKRVLAGGAERSSNTLRSVQYLNSGFTIEKVGSGFPELMATKIKLRCLAYYLIYDEGEAIPKTPFLGVNNYRDDFMEDMPKLITQAIAPIYPPKDFSGVPDLCSPMQFQWHMANAKEADKAFKVVPTEAGDPPADNVSKVSFGQSPVDNGGETIA